MHVQGRHLGPISSLAISISDDVIYSASLDKTVKVWRFPDFKCIETIAAHSGPINAIIATEDGELYTASDDATVRVWRHNFSVTHRSHALTITLSSKSSPVKTLTLSSDGRIVYGGCTDGYVYYWVKGWFSGQLQYGGAIQAHAHAVVCLANVAEYVISGSADTNGKVWAREEDGHHTCLAVLRGHRAPIRSVAAITRNAEEKENGCTVCTGSFDGVLKVWRVTRTSNVGQYSAQSGGKYFEL